MLLSKQTACFSYENEAVQTKIFSHQNGYRFGGTPLAAPVLAAGEGVKELL